MESLYDKSKDYYTYDFRTADKAVAHGCVVMTAREGGSFWKEWVKYVGPLVVDPYLNKVPLVTIVRAITGFGGRIRMRY